MDYVAYYRVSTKRQGQSGLGLDAQKEIVKVALAGKSCKVKVIAEITEIESGRNKERKGIANAIALCKQKKATLIVAKLDRLARDVNFIFTLKDSGIAFVACDIPDFNTLTLGIFASFAQYEAERISNRIKDALAAKKARGESLGNIANIKQGMGKIGNKKRVDNNKSKLLNAYKRATQLLKKMSLRKTAMMLNEENYKTVTDKKFTATAVKNMINLFQKFPN